MCDVLAYYYYVPVPVATHRYEVDVFKETVILGNDALLKCQIPSFVSDYVRVEDWQDSEGSMLSSSTHGKECG